MMRANDCRLMGREIVCRLVRQCLLRLDHLHHFNSNIPSVQMLFNEWIGRQLALPNSSCCNSQSQ